MNQFEQIYTQYIKREGSEALLEYLKKSDFFTAPASTKFHLACEGGLAQHSVNVYKRLVDLVKREVGEDYTKVYSDETLAIVGLLHDVCKTNYYAVEMRNVKEGNEWVKKPRYIVNEKFPFGHGEKSVFILSQYIRVTPEEAMAINWHMGGFDTRVLGGSYAVSDAFYKFKLSLLMHIADLSATYIDEERG
ncbi:MAG TPA: hydrolase [Candidatus Limihabitans stercoravium]|nr:hydrolase [Candidatus Limihabitans stercoravium]